MEKKNDNERPLSLKSIKDIKASIAAQKEQQEVERLNKLAARKEELIGYVGYSENKIKDDEKKQQKIDFLKALCAGNTIGNTAKSLDIPSHAIYIYKKQDEGFNSIMLYILDKLEYLRVVDIQENLLETSDISKCIFEDLYENGLFFEALSYLKESNRIKERAIDRYDKREEFKAQINSGQTIDEKQQFELIIKHVDKSKTTAPDDYK
jgi:hypothetical protein